MQVLVLFPVKPVKRKGRWNSPQILPPTQNSLQLNGQQLLPLLNIHKRLFLLPAPILLCAYTAPDVIHKLVYMFSFFD